MNKRSSFLVSLLLAVVALAGCTGSSKTNDASGTSVGASDKASKVAGAGGTDAHSSDTGSSGSETGASAVGTGDSEPTDTVPETLVPAVTSLTQQPGSADDQFVGAAKDVKLESCKLTGAKWTARGTVTNPSGAKAKYRIYVALNVAGSTDTKALVQTDVEVEDGETKPWSAEADVAVPDLTCILRVERASA